MDKTHPEFSLSILNQILDQGPVAVVVTDKAGHIEYVNRAFIERCGYEQDELIGHKPSLLKSGKTSPAVYQDLWRTISAGHVWRGEMENRTKSGEVFIERQVIAPLRDETGAIAHFVAIKEDVTELHRSSRDLQRTAREQRLLSACNQNLVRSLDEQELLITVCRVLVEEGGYVGAFVVRLASADQPPEMCACYGEGCAELLANLPVDVVAGGKPKVVPIGNGQPSLPGQRIKLFLPLRDEGSTVPLMLVLLSRYPAAPPDSELQFLHELANDLGFGLKTHRMRQSLEESEQRFRTMAEDSVAGIYMIQQGRFVYVNSHLAEIFGYSLEQMLTMGVLDVVAPEDRDKVAENLRRRIDAEIDSLHYELVGLCADGRRIQVEVYGARTQFLGSPAVVGTLLDVSDRYEAETRLRMLQRAIDAASSGIAISDSQQPDNPFIYVNRAFEQLTGYSAEEVVGRNGRFLLGNDLQQPELEKLKAALRRHQSAEVVLRNYHRNGSLFWNQFSVAPVNDETGNTTHYISVFDDITERKSYERQLEQLSNYDALTGLANKNLLRDRLQQSLIHCQRSGGQVALIFFDIDRFKVVHQSLGVVGSDSVLVTIGRRLQGLAGAADTVARLGADEFAWLLQDVADEHQAAHRAEALMTALAQPIDIGGDDLSLTASIGVGIYPRDGDDAESLLGHTESAMFRAAEQRNCYRFYTPSMNEQARDRLALEQDLKRACSQNEFVLYYQPKVSLSTGRIIGSEALMRWNHPVRGLVPPIEFIPAAEEIGAIAAMGKWALAEACSQMARINASRSDPLSVAVNLSARQLGDESLMAHVQQVLDQSGLAPELLECELTESMLMEDPEKAQVLLEQFKQLQVRIALDDFGTGYSSLSYLKRFPIDTLKIDRSFVKDIPGDENDLVIPRAIIAMARSLRMYVVAEGVETVAQQQYLAGEGCDCMQGFLFSRPLPLNEFEALLAAE